MSRRRRGRRARCADIVGQAFGRGRTIRIGAARLLAEQAFFNDGISRAYYGAHQAVAALMSARGTPTKTHKGLILAFRKYLRNEERSHKAAVNLARLQGLREQCDYTSFKASEAEAKTAIERAELIVQLVEEELQ